MFPSSSNLVKNTVHQVVLPFYMYAALSFLAATILLFISTTAFTQHYFHPQILAVTHLMALGWGTMIILGASHQLVPVLIEAKLYSNKLAFASFVLAAIGIPLLVYGFYFFNLGWPSKWGAILINAALVAYMVNLAVSMAASKNENVHAFFVFTAALWLLLTTIVGLLLVFNFSENILPKDSLHYLPLHAHLGIIGWFLLLVIGVGSRLIPMFLISKYSNTKLLWVIYSLVNGALILFVIIFLYFTNATLYLIPVAAVLSGIALFIYYCYNAFKQRIRKKADEQMKISLLSVCMMALPVIVLFIIVGCIMAGNVNPQLVTMYGFIIFFGWLTAIILGMTFKTLPFIVWNKEYHLKAGLGKTPNPKDLFSSRVFNAMGIFYLLGFFGFVAGLYFANDWVLKVATIFLLITSVLYNWNVLKLFIHKSVRS